MCHKTDYWATHSRRNNTMCKKNTYFAYTLIFQKPEIRRYFQSWTTMGANTRFSWHGIFTLLNIWSKTFLPQRT